MIDLKLGNNLEVLRSYPDNFFDSVITDPPYALTGSKNSKKGFMGQSWDGSLPSVNLWEEVLRVSKPGATLLTFGGTRTFHRLACTIEDAGWELFDTIMWVFGQGFPKSHNISKAIDREKGLEREVIDSFQRIGRSAGILGKETEITREITKPASDLAKQFDGWGSALKPAYEPVIVARKPNDGNFAENAEKWGVSGLWIDGARIPTLDNLGRPQSKLSGDNEFLKGLKDNGFNDS